MRQRILDGAHHAVLDKGYRATTMPAIAAEAGVSVGLLYRYFSSKEQLYLAMCDAVIESNLDALAVEFGQIPDPRERLGRAIDLLVQDLDGGAGAFVVAGWADAETNPELRDLLRGRCDQLRRFAAMLIREAVARGEAPDDLEVERLSAATAMLLDGVLAHQAEMGDRFDPRAAAEAIRTLLERALLGDARGEVRDEAASGRER